MKIADFDYSLPKELIAQYPARTREESRMMVLDKARQSYGHKKFTDIVSYLKKGDCLVLNNARVINARLVGKSETGGKAEIFILEKLDGARYKALLKPVARLGGKNICFGNDVRARVIEAKNPESIVEFDSDVDLESIGRVPLPPYIKREPEELDRARYQTVYADRPGATASPTAGLHFTDDILSKIKTQSVEIAYVTLYVSYGTFAPVLEDNVEDHHMHSEYFELPKDTLDKIRKTKQAGGRIISVGTTTTRVLEANAGKESGTSGRTDLFIYPGYKFKVTDMLLTNFHLPKSTLMMLVSAFAGQEFILKAYEEAIKERYRFFSYGDCMLIG